MAPTTDARSEAAVSNGMESRKARHIDVCLTETVDYQTVTTGLERVALRYNALTQTSLGAIDLHTEFLGVRLEAPVLIGTMLGSQRIMLGDEVASASFAVRDVAPEALLVGNIGLAQLSDDLVPDLV